MKFIFDSEYRFRALDGRGFYRNLPDEKYLKKKYKTIFHKKLDLNNPQSFNEKLQWLKLFDRKPLYTTLVDKYAVRKYIASKIGDEYLIPLVGGPWKNFDEINFDELPDQFVLKCTHDSGGVVVCKDKSKLDFEEIRSKVNKSLARNYYYYGREWPYKDVPRQIIAEAYITDGANESLTDYKFFCFDGTPKALFIATDRYNKDEEIKFDFYDMDFNHLPFTNGHPNANVSPRYPSSFKKMKELAAKLSEGIPQVRVDFYNVGGKVYFGELTFFHFSGMVPFKPEKWDKIFGEWINLPKNN
jgi:hypothetical protein